MVTGTANCWESEHIRGRGFGTEVHENFCSGSAVVWKKIRKAVDGIAIETHSQKPQ
jgi:hypothetical protein